MDIVVGILAVIGAACLVYTFGVCIIFRINSREDDENNVSDGPKN